MQFEAAQRQGIGDQAKAEATNAGDRLPVEDAKERGALMRGIGAELEKNVAGGVEYDDGGYCEDAKGAGRDG